jgi:hypothetical protein
MRPRSGGKPPACRATRRPAGIRSQIPHPRADEDADQAVADLYQTHYRPLVRLAALLVSDLATAEEIVQDSFAAGQRVALRRFHLGDVAEFVAYRSSEQVARFQSWDAPYPREAGERLVRQMMNRHPDTPGMAGLAHCRSSRVTRTGSRRGPLLPVRPQLANPPHWRLRHVMTVIIGGELAQRLVQGCA